MERRASCTAAAARGRAGLAAPAIATGGIEAVRARRAARPTTTPGRGCRSTAITAHPAESSAGAVRATAGPAITPTNSVSSTAVAAITTNRVASCGCGPATVAAVATGS